MKVLGLTGGIASGKSTVSKMLRQQGAIVLCADTIYHELVAPGLDGRTSAVAQRIGERFAGALLADGSLDRPALGAVVFADARARADLEAITHPAVATAVAERLQQHRDAGAAMVIYDVPLLFERGLHQGLDGVMVVWVPPAIQIERLMRRDGLDRAAADQRLAAQLPLDTKRAQATWVIDNSGSVDATRVQVEDLWDELCVVAAARS